MLCQRIYIDTDNRRKDGCSGGAHNATAVREAFPELKVIASCCANGFEGYLPTRATLEEVGGYETNASPYSPDIEECFVTAAVKIISALWEK